MKNLATSYIFPDPTEKDVTKFHSHLIKMLNQYFGRLSYYLNSVHKGNEGIDGVTLLPLDTEPSYKFQGMLVFADGSSWNPGGGAGLYVYMGSGVGTNHWFCLINNTQY